MFRKKVKKAVMAAAQQKSSQSSAVGDKYRDARQWSLAVAAYKEFLAEHPDNFAIHVQLGNCAKENGDFSTSFNAYSRAIELRENDPDLHLQFGHLLKMMGRRKDAREAYSRALQLNHLLIDARRELDSLDLQAAEDSDFKLPHNLLDFIKARDLKDLLSQAAEISEHPDPFDAYRELVES